jgi:hypothetical protein
MDRLESFVVSSCIAVLVPAQYWSTAKAAVMAYGKHEDIEQRCR